MNAGTPLKKGMLVQLDPDKCRNPMLGGCIMVVDEEKSFGCQGYIQGLGADGKRGGQAFYRADWSEMELVGHAVWVVD